MNNAKGSVLTRDELDFMEAQFKGTVENTEEPELDENDLALIDEAIEAYNIPRKFIFSSKVSEIHPLRRSERAGHAKEAVIVTKGGKRVKHLKGEEAEFKLNYTEITGNPPKKIGRKKCEPLWNMKKDKWVVPGIRDKALRKKVEAGLNG